MHKGPYSIHAIRMLPPRQEDLGPNDYTESSAAATYLTLVPPYFTYPERTER
jgi:hypothetical protein